MRIVILGAGGIGSIVSAFSDRAGHEVTLVARPGGTCRRSANAGSRPGRGVRARRRRHDDDRRDPHRSGHGRVHARLRAGRPTEIEETAGYAVAEADRLGVEVPTLRVLCELVPARSTARR